MKSIILIPQLQKAVIDGRKTKTRRLIEPDNIVEDQMHKPEVIQFLIDGHAKYKKNEILYLREGFRLPALVDNLSPKQVEASPVEFRLGGTINCVGDHIKDPGRWRSPLHLPEQLARTFVRITNVKVERLKDINDDDAIAEGVEVADSELNSFELHYKDYSGQTYEKYGKKCEVVFSRASGSFQSLWTSIYGQKSTESNPWVFAYTFELCDRNGNALIV